MNTLVSILVSFLSYLGYNPLASVSLGGWLLTGHNEWVMLLLASFFLSFDIDRIGGSIVDLIMRRNLNGFLKSYNGPFEITSSPEFSNSAIRAALHLDNKLMAARFKEKQKKLLFLSVGPKNSDRLLVSPKAFQHNSFTSLIAFPSWQKFSTPFEKFVCLHEIGHLDRFGYRAMLAGWASIISLIVMFVYVAPQNFHLDYFWAFVGVWAIFFVNALHFTSISPIFLEMYADSFALIHLSSEDRLSATKALDGVFKDKGVPGDYQRRLRALNLEATNKYIDSTTKQIKNPPNLYHVLRFSVFFIAFSCFFAGAYFSPPSMAMVNYLLIFSICTSALVFAWQMYFDLVYERRTIADRIGAEI